MIKQNIFDFKFKNNDNINNFYVNNTNEKAFYGVVESDHKEVFLTGPHKSGKSFLGLIWAKKNKAIVYNNNLKKIIDSKKNILIDESNILLHEENIFHIINNCKLNNKSILIISPFDIKDINFKLKDLVSRLKSISYYSIEKPDDDMLLKILTKLLIEKQFIINSHDIFYYILNRANRSYKEIFDIVEKLNTLSIEKKRQLTIPLIKEIL